MTRVLRHDAITLHTEGASESDFERFMQDELFPLFAETYQGPVRTSVADLNGQSLLKDAKIRRKYLWVTVWSGSPDSVRGATFPDVRSVKTDATEATLRVLKKLDSFGERSVEHVFQESLSMDVTTNV